MLYKNNSNNLNEIKEIDFKSEKELQTLCENNLKTLLNLEFVATEFTVTDLRLDTVAFDSESNAFIIIEYKNTKNASVIDQGYTYLSTLFNHKADFVLEYNRVTEKRLGVLDVDWTQSRVIFISPMYTKYQINSINFKDLPIELWKIKKFSNDTIFFEEIKPVNSTATISSIAPKFGDEAKIQNQSKANIIETKNYSEDELLRVGDDLIIEIYNNLKDYILELDENISIKPTKLYIGFFKNRKSLISIKIQKGSLVVWLNTDLVYIDDPKKLVRDVSNIGHQGVGNCEIKLSDNSNIGYIEDIIRKYFESK